MSESGFHFAQPDWFWGLLALAPVAWWLWRSAAKAAKGPIHRYADPHLLPHLSGTRELKTSERWGRFFGWSALWALLLLAMAGPRWDYDDVRLFHPGDNLLILLDISRSMDATDVAPSRLGRARQEIQDLIIQNHRLRLGLIAFASVPHVIAPVTEDTHTLMLALPAISTSLSRLQGSRLHQALDRAEILLNALPEDSARSMLLITDGDFDEPDLLPRIQALAEHGVRLHVLGVGTPAGSSVPGQRGAIMVDAGGRAIRSALDEPLLRSLAEAGRGIYRRADYRDDDTRAVLEAAAISRIPAEAGNERTRIWNDRFYLPVLLLAALLLPQFRTRYRFGSGTPRRSDRTARGEPR